MEGEGIQADIARVYGEIADTLELVGFVVPGDETGASESERRRLIDLIRHHLLPRIADPEAPVVAVVAGPSGAGKSTLVNSLAQDDIGVIGAVRPTTVRPAVWAHPDHDVLTEAGFLRRFQLAADGRLDLAVSDDELVANMVVVDTPPLDLGDASGRLVARVAAGMADLAIFVTTQRRYADAVGWDFLRFCQQRGLPVLFVVNRLAADVRGELVLQDLAKRLHTAGLLTTPDETLLFAIFDHAEVEWHGGLSASSVSSLRKELGELSDPGFRGALVTEATQASGRSVVRGLAEIIPRLRSQVGLVADLRRRVDAAYDEETSRLVTELEDGGFSGLADHELWEQAAADLTGIVTRRAGLASQAVAESWSATPYGAEVLADGGQSLWRHGHETTTLALATLTEWGSGLGDVAREFTRRGRLSKRAEQRVVRSLWPLVLAPRRRVSRRLRRRYRNVADQLVAAARRGLTDVLAAALRADADRFAGTLPVIDPERTSRLVDLATRAQALLDRSVAERTAPDA